MLKNIDVLYFPPLEWTGLWQRPQHLSLLMAKTFHRVFYIYGSGLRNICLKDIRRIVKQLRFISVTKRTTSKLPQNLHFISPFQIPVSASPLARKINAFLLEKKILKITLSQDRPRIWWVSSPAPYLFLLLNRLRIEKYIFDWIDDYSLFKGLDPQIKMFQDRFVQNAKLVFVTSRALEEKAKALGQKNVKYFPNGVDLDHWRKNPPLEPVKSKADEKQKAYKVLYFGTISHWLDLELIDRIARKNRNLQFYFAGPIAEDSGFDNLLKSNHNIKWLGIIPYENLPELVREADICWIPFKQSSIINTINPVKIYEYLASGKPVVSIPLPDLKGLSSVVRFAKTHEEFEKSIYEIMEDERNIEKIDLRIQIAANYSWEKLWQNISNDIVRFIT